MIVLRPGVEVVEITQWLTANARRVGVHRYVVRPPAFATVRQVLGLPESS